MTALGVNQSATTPPHKEVHKPLNGPITDNLLSCISFCLKQRLMKKKKTGYCTCTSTKIVFRVFFNLNIEEGNVQQYISGTSCLPFCVGGCNCDRTQKKMTF